jgi:hypothetical protein
MKASERAAASLLGETDVAVDANGDEPLNQACYEEYVRGFDEIPVLEDAVVIPPRRPTPPSFVRGERRSVRKQESSRAFMGSICRQRRCPRNTNASGRERRRAPRASAAENLARPANRALARFAITLAAARHGHAPHGVDIAVK